MDEKNNLYEETIKKKLVDGRNYTIRKNRNYYLYPSEWKEFFNSLRDSHKLIFEVLINTGARIDEVLHLKYSDLRKRQDIYYISLLRTKVRAKKKERYSRRRDITISSSLHKKILKHMRENDKSINDYVFMKKQNPEKKDFKKVYTSLYLLFRRKIKKIKPEDWFMYSIHNIRKTHGMWLKEINIEIISICYRLGHDLETYYKHYGSPSTMSSKDRREIVKILGEIDIR